MNLELFSERLTLTPFCAADVDIAVALFTSPEVRRYAGGPMSAETIQESMPNWTRRGGSGFIGIWCVSETDGGDKVGTVALLPMPIEEKETDWESVVPGKVPDAEVEVGYFLKPAAWGKGYATEACRRILQFAFEASPLEEIVATFDPKNNASRNVLLKSGFTDCGTRRCYGEESPDFRVSRAQWSVR